MLYWESPSLFSDFCVWYTQITWTRNIGISTVVQNSNLLTILLFAFDKGNIAELSDESYVDAILVG